MTPTNPTVPTGAFARYRRSQIAELRPYIEGETLSDRVSISPADRDAGHPKPGDMIARNPASHDDQWLIAADYFAANFEPVSTPNETQNAAVPSPPPPVDDGWRSIESAPPMVDVLVQTAGGCVFKAHLSPGAAEDENGPCDAWCAAYEGVHPKCWTDGICWASNEDEEPSDPPVRWRAAPPAEESGTMELCDDCPPPNYPTDKTRCTPCPRRAIEQEAGR